MKSKTIWIIVIVVALILIIGYFTNWFGIKKPATTTTTTASTTARKINYSVDLSKYYFAGTGSPSDTGFCRGASDLIIGPNTDGSYSCYKQLA